MTTKQMFTVDDLNKIIGIPILELSDDFQNFDSKNIGFSVEKRTMVLNKVRRDNKEWFYFLGCIGTEIIDGNRAVCALDMVQKLNHSKRYYRLATSDEIQQIFSYMFSYLDDIPEYIKIKS